MIAAAEGEGFETRATPEGLFAYTYKSAAKGNRLQSRAGFKGVLSDRTQAVGQNDVFKTRAAPESLLLNRRKAAAEGNRLQSRAAFKRVSS